MDSNQTLPRAKPTVVGGYELRRLLGAGGFGSVWEAHRTDSGLYYAVKQIKLTPDDAERYRNEALYPAKIATESLHVLSVHSSFYDEEAGYFYLVTELIRHGDLGAFLKTHRPLPIEQALTLGVGIAKGLSAIHEQGIVHRDLKPSNVLMDRKDDRWVPKIADFGLARSTDSVSIGEFASAGYAAPEQVDLSVSSPPGMAADLFSLGMVLFELLAGEPFAAHGDLRAYARWLRERRSPPLLSTKRPELIDAAALDSALTTLLQYDAGLRTTRAADVADALESALRLQTQSAGPGVDRAQPPEVTQKGTQNPPRARMSTRAAAAIVGTVALLVAGVVWTVDRGPDGQSSVGLAHFAEGRYDQALPLLLSSAEEGDTHARSALGRMYLAGLAVRENPAEARRWLELAASENDADAQCALGDMYGAGNGVPTDAAHALRQYQAAATQNAACGQSGLGRLHMTGTGVPANFDEGLRWYELAAAQGDTAATEAIARTRTAWALPPLFSAAWQLVEGAERRQEIARVRQGAVSNVDLSDPRRLRKVAVDFYPGASLFELEVGRGGTVGILTYIRKDDQFVRIDGRSAQIHTLSASAPIRVDTLPAAVAFLRFFMSAVQGEDGLFRIVDDEHDLHWHASAPPAVRTAIADRIKRLDLSASSSGGWNATATVDYGRGLYYVDLWLKPNGQVDMLNDTPFAADLPVATERFDSRGVRVRTDVSTN
jgi:TPR repeat protein